MPVIEGGVSSELRDWIEAQHMFFVATAPLDPAGHVNLSPRRGKGLSGSWTSTPSAGST